MSGEPIEEAKKAAIMMVEKLRATDKVSVVTFDHSIDVVVPSTSLRDKRSVINSIQHIHTYGSTNLHGGCCWCYKLQQEKMKNP